MENIKEFLVSKKATTFYWQTANGLIILAISFFAQIDLVYSAIAIALLNGTTKWINQTYLN